MKLLRQGSRPHVVHSVQCACGENNDSLLTVFISFSVLPGTFFPSVKQDNYNSCNDLGKTSMDSGHTVDYWQANA